MSLFSTSDTIKGVSLKSPSYFSLSIITPGHIFSMLNERMTEILTESGGSNMLLRLI